MITKFKLFENRHSKIDSKSIDEECRNLGIKNYIINSDGSISVGGSVSLLSIEYIPIKFRKVSGNFYISGRLDNLIGCPYFVGGDFNCSCTGITSLEGCPEIIKGVFSCYGNRLTSLEHGPKEIGQDIQINDNDISSLVGIPKGFNGCVYCSDNNIRNFDGLPNFFENEIQCFSNPVFEVYDLFDQGIDGLNPEAIYYIREFDVIQGDNVIYDRLVEAFNSMGFKVPGKSSITLKNYNLI